jgi:hypothetical protein
MVQMRLMGDDEDLVRTTAEVVVQVLRNSGHVIVGDIRDLGVRGPGARLVVEVLLPGPTGGEPPPTRVRAERADRPRRRELPPGRRKIE